MATCANGEVASWDGPRAGHIRLGFSCMDTAPLGPSCTWPSFLLLPTQPNELLHKAAPFPPLKTHGPPPTSFSQRFSLSAAHYGEARAPYNPREGRALAVRAASPSPAARTAAESHTRLVLLNETATERVNERHGTQLRPLAGMAVPPRVQRAPLSMMVTPACLVLRREFP